MRSCDKEAEWMGVVSYQRRKERGAVECELEMRRGARMQVL